MDCPSHYKEMDGKGVAELPAKKVVFQVNQKKFLLKKVIKHHLVKLTRKKREKVRGRCWSLPPSNR